MDSSAAAEHSLGSSGCPSSVQFWLCPVEIKAIKQGDFCNKVIFGCTKMSVSLCSPLLQPVEWCCHRCEQWDAKEHGGLYYKRERYDDSRI